MGRRRRRKKKEKKEVVAEFRQSVSVTGVG